MELGLGDLYSEQAVASGITTEKADLIFASLPVPDPARVPDPALRQDPRARRRLLPRLEEAGFQLDWGEDGSGLFMKYLRRGSGYYIDVGASELVIDGKIKLVAGQVARDHRDRGRCSTTARSSRPT